MLQLLGCFKNVFTFVEINKKALEKAQIIEILRGSGLKKTPVRVAVLAALMGNNTALSQPQLEALFGQHESRITIYRVLRDLEEAHLIHRIYDKDGVAKYALYKHNHAHNHVHFNCTTCNDLVCLEAFEIEIPTLPQGYKMNAVRYTVEGICQKCDKI